MTMQTQTTPQTPAEVAAHIALDRAMEPFAALEGYTHTPLLYRQGATHLGALLDLDATHGITAHRWDDPERPETIVTLTSTVASIHLSWSRNEFSGVDNGWRLDSVPHPGVSTWPGRRYRSVLGSFTTLRPLSSYYPAPLVEGIEDETSHMAPATAAAKVGDLVLYKGSRTRPLPSDRENFPDVKAWIQTAVLEEATAAVMDAQPWGEGELDAVVRPILDRAWPVAAR